MPVFKKLSILLKQDLIPTEFLNFISKSVCQAKIQQNLPFDNDIIKLNLKVTVNFNLLNRFLHLRRVILYFHWLRFFSVTVISKICL